MNTYTVRNKHDQIIFTGQFPVSLKAEYESIGFTVDKLESILVNA